MCARFAHDYHAYHSLLTHPAARLPCRLKCAPPLREEDNRYRLLDALKDGSIDSVATDHSPSGAQPSFLAAGVASGCCRSLNTVCMRAPCASQRLGTGAWAPLPVDCGRLPVLPPPAADPALKLLQEGDFLKAWGGISGLQYALPSTWSPCHMHGMNLTWLTRAWSTYPAQLANLGRKKGRLAAGYDADIVVWGPEQDADTSREALQHKHKETPYNGMRMQGRVLATFVGGSQVFGEQQGVAPAACGAVILPKQLLPFP